MSALGGKQTFAPNPFSTAPKLVEGMGRWISRSAKSGCLAAFSILLLSGCGRGVSNSSSFQHTRDYKSEVGQTTTLRAGNQTLYVPTEWLDSFLFTETRNPLRDSLEPLVDPHETPGVVHDLKGGYHGVPLQIKNPSGVLHVPADFPVFSIILNLRRGSGDQSGFERPLGAADKEGWAQVGQGNGFVDTHGGAGVDSPYQAMVRNGHRPVTNFPNEAALVIQGLTVRYRWREPDAPQPEWRKLRHRVANLMEWLATPPGQRPSVATNI